MEGTFNVVRKTLRLFITISNSNQFLVLFHRNVMLWPWAPYDERKKSCLSTIYLWQMMVEKKFRRLNRKCHKYRQFFASNFQVTSSRTIYIYMTFISRVWMELVKYHYHINFLLLVKTAISKFCRSQILSCHFKKGVFSQLTIKIKLDNSQLSV